MWWMCIQIFHQYMGKYRTEVTQSIISIFINQSPSDGDRVTGEELLPNGMFDLTFHLFFFFFFRTNNSPVLDSMSYCTIELSIGLVLYLKDINPTTALICILKKESRINEGKRERK